METMCAFQADGETRGKEAGGQNRGKPSKIAGKGSF